MELCFVTSNKSKLLEIEHALGMKLKVVHVDLPEMQAINVSDVVEDKARRAYKLIKRPVIVEDTGLYIRAFNDFPGALVKLLLESAGTAGICKMLDSFADRGAYAESCFCVYDGRKGAVFLGRSYGTIAKRPRKGINDFGWNSIFVPDGYRKTYSEMAIAEKNKISMRAKAVKRLRKYLSALKGRT